LVFLDYYRHFTDPETYLLRPYNPNGTMQIPHISLHGYIHGQRPRGRPRKKWMDNIREDCAEMDMSLIKASRKTSTNPLLILFPVLLLPAPYLLLRHSLLNIFVKLFNIFW